MLKYVYDADSDTLLRTEEAEPVCGDYCENCGDCLHCHADTPCRNGGSHWWVVYEEGSKEPCPKNDEVW